MKSRIICLAIVLLCPFASAQWFSQNPLPTLNGLGAVSFTDANTGTVVGRNGTILRTTDGGASWVFQPTGTTNQLNGVSFIDAYIGTAVGVAGTILRTTNGGTRWTMQEVTWGPLQDRVPDLYGVSFKGVNTGWIVGDGGTILRTTTGGETWIEANQHADLPEHYLLSQNYPNPFNPSTIIRYGLPNRAHVTLSVLNTLGQQVATLVQGQQQAGSYEVKFDGSALASGMYFYRLQAGDFVATKRLLLLK